MNAAQFVWSFEDNQLQALPKLPKDELVEFSCAAATAATSTAAGGDGLAMFRAVVSETCGGGRTWYIKDSWKNDFPGHQYVKHCLFDSAVDEAALCEKLIAASLSSASSSSDRNSNGNSNRNSAAFCGKNKKPLFLHLVLSAALPYKDLDSLLFKLSILKTLETGERVWRLGDSSVVFVEVPVCWLTERSILRYFPVLHVHTPVELLKTLDAFHSADDEQLLAMISATNVDVGPTSSSGAGAASSSAPRRTLSSTPRLSRVPLQPKHEIALRQLRGLQQPHFTTLFNHLATSAHGQRSGRAALRAALEHCGVKDPSWAQLSLFARFLATQLTACENCVFTSLEGIPDCGLQGFHSFVVKLSVQMSRDFSIHSVDVSDESHKLVMGGLGGNAGTGAGANGPNVDGDGADDDAERAARELLRRNTMLQFRRPWETSPHPYLFFNEDGQTFTFMGFTVDRQGNLVEPGTARVLERGIMTAALQTGLYHQRVNFQEVRGGLVGLVRFLVVGGRGGGISDGGAVGLEREWLCRSENGARIFESLCIFDFGPAFFLGGGHFSSLGDALMLEIAICGFRWGRGRIHMR